MNGFEPPPDMNSMGAGMLGGLGAGLVLIQLAIFLFYLAVGWKIFLKAGQPGWAILIPIYNAIVMLRMLNRPWWWLILWLIPLVNLVILILINIDLAKAFGKGGGYAILLILFGFIFLPILAFGSSQYTKPQRA